MLDHSCQVQRHAHAERGHDLYETPSVAVGIARPLGLAPSRVRGAVRGFNRLPLTTVAVRRSLLRSALSGIREQAGKQAAMAYPERKEEALKIDPETAQVFFHWGSVVDPYGIYPHSDEDYCIGRNYFARSPTSEVWVLFDDLPTAVCDRRGLPRLVISTMAT